eukprot:523855-Rhodomonas_salina.1
MVDSGIRRMEIDIGTRVPNRGMPHSWTSLQLVGARVLLAPRIPVQETAPVHLNPTPRLRFFRV